MGVAEALAEAGAKPAGKRPWFLDADTEVVLAVSMGVAQELAVVRQRMDTLERLLQQKGVLAPGDIDAFAPDPQACVERALWSQEYIVRILRIVQQRNAAAVGDVASEDVGDELGSELGAPG